MAVTRVSQRAVGDVGVHAGGKGDIPAPVGHGHPALSGTVVYAVGVHLAVHRPAGIRRVAGLPFGIAAQRGLARLGVFNAADRQAEGTVIAVGDAGRGAVGIETIPAQRPPEPCRRDIAAVRIPASGRQGAEAEVVVAAIHSPAGTRGKDLAGVPKRFGVGLQGHPFAVSRDVPAVGAYALELAVHVLGRIEVARDALAALGLRAADRRGPRVEPAAHGAVFGLAVEAEALDAVVDLVVQVLSHPRLPAYLHRTVRVAVTRISQRAVGDGIISAFINRNIPVPIRAVFP